MRLGARAKDKAPGHGGRVEAARGGAEGHLGGYV